jgi:hypothetical protein
MHMVARRVALTVWPQHVFSTDCNTLQHKMVSFMTGVMQPTHHAYMHEIARQHKMGRTCTCSWYATSTSYHWMQYSATVCVNKGPQWGVLCMLFYSSAAYFSHFAQPCTSALETRAIM